MTLIITLGKLHRTYMRRLGSKFQLSSSLVKQLQPAKARLGREPHRHRYVESYLYGNLNHQAGEHDSRIRRRTGNGQKPYAKNA